MSEFQPIVSSNLESAAFVDGDTIIVRFKSGKAYAYVDTDEGLWKRFKKEFDGKDGRSAGKFHAKHIRPLPAKQLDDWK
ncbi:MAG: KTSC domain-containing protein [Acidobacteria bacterium]|nr:KTSC domain-containing protein [Acidobacteriota bacterium]